MCLQEEAVLEKGYENTLNKKWRVKVVDFCPYEVREFSIGRVARKGIAPTVEKLYEEIVKCVNWKQVAELDQSYLF